MILLIRWLYHRRQARKQSAHPELSDSRKEAR
jgi:hypothetical protein